MTSRRRTLPALLGASVVCLLLAAVTPSPPAGAAGACAAGQACLVVHLQGSAQTRVVTPAEIDAWADQQPSDYRIRSAPGGEVSVQRVNAALTIRGLVTRLATEGGPFAGLAPGDVRLVKVPDTGSSYVATLTPPALGPEGSNGYSQLSPVVRTLGGTNAVGYLRPLTNDTDDVNDVIETVSQGPLDLTLSTTGTVLRPSVSASPQQVDAGDPVDLTVDVPDAPRGLSYAWTFDDGATSSDRAPRHTWAATGTYAARVTVTADDGSIGQASATVSVGERPRPTSTPTAT